MLDIYYNMVLCWHMLNIMDRQTENIFTFSVPIIIFICISFDLWMEKAMRQNPIIFVCTRAHETGSINTIPIQLW